MFISSQQAKNCALIGRIPPLVRCVIARMPGIVITVRSKHSVRPVSRGAASVAASMKKCWIGSEATRRPKPSKKKAHRKRNVWVEPLFAEGKDWHGMRRFRLRRLWRVNCEALVRAAGQNLKRLLKKCGWGRRPCPAEALCGFVLAVFGWVTRLFSEYRSFPSSIGSHSSTRMKKCTALSW